MRLKIIMIVTVMFGVIYSTKAQEMASNEVLDNTMERIEETPELRQNTKVLNSQRESARTKVCSILDEANLQPEQIPYKKKFKGEGYELKAKIKRNGTVHYDLKLDNEDIEWYYKADSSNNEVREILESPKIVYYYDKEGEEVTERIDGETFNYLLDKNKNESNETFASEDLFWTIETEATGEQELKYETESASRTFRKDAEGNLRF